MRADAGLSQEKLCAELQRRGCDIGRTTYAKYEAGELNIRASVIIELKKIYPKNAGYGEVFFRFMKEHQRYFLLLNRVGLSGMVLNTFNATNEELAGDMPRDSIERYRLYYAAGASYNAVIQWLKGGCKESAEDMARYTLDFLGNRE